jgi:2-polyprenyl-6-methoxyphenol hydroxylase-like FAD-dependent oxidoreductase
VVLGASIAGLLTARALAEHFATVTLVDRDVLPAGAASRKGVPQDSHLHGQLARGLAAIEDLLPGATADLTARGAVPVDVQRDFVWVNGGNPLPRAESGLRGLCVSRTTLEAYVRERVAALPGVTVLDRHEAIGLSTSADGETVDGAWVLPPGGEHRWLPADLVVDATGRGNRGPEWLRAIGYEPPAEERVDAGTVYVSRDYRRTPADAAFAGIFAGPSPATPYGGFTIASDGDRWMVVMLGVGPEQAPPTDPDGYLAFAARLPDPRIHALLAAAEPLTEPRRLRVPPAVRRRYERAARLPGGFVANGDAICTLNASYAQGMSVAAAEAVALRDCLREHRAGSGADGRSGLARRFFTAAAAILDAPWEMSVGGDLGYPHVAGRRTVKTRLIGRYVARVLRAAGRDERVARAFLRVANLMAPPPSLFAPGILARVLRYGGPVSQRARTGAPAPARDRTNGSRQAVSS